LQNKYSHIASFKDKAGCNACFIFLLLFIASCSSSIRFANTNAESNKSNTQGAKTIREVLVPGTVLVGKASYYGDEFHGRKTANGEIYDRNKFSAAHKSLAFGTTLKVRNLKNNREIIVRINDRGPFVDGRIIDLSYSAAKELYMLNDGVVDVELTIIE
jgi:rare lipoprotein A